MTPAPIKSFGRYEIVRKLGRSMTDVYLAFDPDAARRVVLKIVEPCENGFTAVIVEAEKRGAAIQQQLHSLDGRILEVYETGEIDGCFYLAMQYAEGASLSELIQQHGRLDPLRAARYAEDVASQLVTLHSFLVEVDGRKQAIVHGDIKPSNIQIGPRGEVWLLDFGIAKAITATRNLTRHNLGSPAYCSPERLRLGQVDAQADLWALGVCLYEMIAGLPPYHAQSTRRLENLIQSRRPPRALPEHTPDALRAIIRKALAADIAHRYETAADLQTDLRAFIERRATAAESRPAPAWDANETLRRDPPPSRASIPVPQRAPSFRLPAFEWTRLLGSLAAGIAAGLLCFVPAASFYRFWRESAPLRAVRDYRQTPPAAIDADVRRFQSMQREGGLPNALSLVKPLGLQLRAALVEAGDDVFDRWRNNSDSDPTSADWARAVHCYTRALELDPSNIELRGKRALAEGFIALAQSPKAAEVAFRESARLWPKSPDPHLALARAAVYGSHNMGQAIAEFHIAERLGYKLGPRELEQQADGYVYRAEQQIKSAQHAPTQRSRLLALAARDLSRARALYEPLAGYANVNARLERLDSVEATARALAEPPPPAVRKTARRRWR